MIALGLIILGAILWTIRNILMLGFAAVILVVLITIPVRFLRRFGIGRTPAIILTFLGIFFLLYLITALLLPILIEQFIALTTVTIPSGIERIVDFVNSGELQQRIPFLEDLEFADEFRIDSELIQNVAQQALDTIRSLGGTVVPFVSGLANTLLSILIVFFLSIFFLGDPDRYQRGLIQLAPLWYRHRVRFILERIYHSLRRWIYAVILGISITGIGTFIGLTMVGIEQAAALAVLTALFSFIPNFGELMAAIVALAVGAVQAPDSLFWIIVVIYGVSFIQGQIFGPLITSESVDVPPVLILLGQIIVGGFFGFLGILLAVPLIVVVMVLIQEIYIKDILGDRVDHTFEPPASSNRLRRTGRNKKGSEREEKLLPDGVQAG
jgi:predicted PurR-regulated permease PerM